MKFPRWAPPELVTLHKEKLPKVLEEQKRFAAYLRENPGQTDWQTAVENDDIHIGHYFITSSTELKLMEALATDPRMENVWASLKKRVATFKPQRQSLRGGMSQSGNLLGACIRAEEDWLGLPKRTKKESRKLYGDIAALSIQLTQLLLEIDSREFLMVRNYIKPERLDEFQHALELDDRSSGRGSEAYLNHLLGELIPMVPGILLELHHKAAEEQKNPRALGQPNAPDAKLRYYIRKLSAYFKAAYGTPLHAHVAAVVSAVLKTDVDEDRVRALIRMDKESVKKKTRKQMDQLRKEASGS